MKITVLLILAGMFSAGVLGCAQSTIKPVEQSADHGQPPTNYEQKIRQYWQTSLKDPNSLQVKEFTKPEKDFVYSAQEKPHSYDLYEDVIFSPVYGYRVCATYNAKNSFGGYAGFKTETFFFDNTGEFFVPLVVPEGFMSGMQRKNTFSEKTRLTSNPCK